MRREFVHDELQIVVVVFNRLDGVEIEEGPAIGGPASSFHAEDGGCRAKITDSFDLFHAAASGRFETNRHADKCRQLTALAVPGIDHVVFKVAADPLQPARLAAAGRQIEEPRLKMLALTPKVLAGSGQLLAA